MATIYAGTYTDAAGTAILAAGAGITLTAGIDKLTDPARADGGAGYSYPSTGSFSGNGNGGTGGAGMILDAAGRLVNFGAIMRGQGGQAALLKTATDGGDGGDGVSFTVLDTLINHGRIFGGSGVDGGPASGSVKGAGGIAVDLAAGRRVTNLGEITGGDGANSKSANVGGTGGAGVALAKGGLLKNGATISGGNGGNAACSAGGGTFQLDGGIGGDGVDRK